MRPPTTARSAPVASKQRPMLLTGVQWPARQDDDMQDGEGSGGSAGSIRACMMGGMHTSGPSSPKRGDEYSSVR